MKKFVFANQLRGIAALLVVMTHYFGTFFAEQELLAARTFSPNLHLLKTPWVHLFELEYQGPFGVALFFLISGFVIPFSLKKTSLAGFLVNRVLRIFPTYICCLAIGTLAVCLSAHYWGQAYTYDTSVLLANALLVHNLLGIPSMDAVNWTLAIEIKFYVLAALGASVLLRPSLAYGGAVLVAILGLTWHGAAGSAIATPLLMELNYILFMLIGCLFYQHAMGLLSTAALALRSFVLLCAFGWNWSMGPQQGQFPAVTVWYCCAYGVFFLCYLNRERFKPVALLDFLAAISYPLYCVHALFGYCAMKILIDQGCRYGVAVLLTLPATIGLAYAVHRTVENGSNTLGRRWGHVLSEHKVANTR